MTEQQNTQPNTAYAIRHENDQLVAYLRIVLDDSGTNISNKGEGKNFTEFSTFHSHHGNKNGKIEIVDDKGKLHVVSGFSVFTAIDDTRKPVTSSKIKPIAKMTAKEKVAYIAELEANQK